MQPIVYRGRVVAVCTPERFFLSDELERRANRDPERRFVIVMCLYAGLVARGAVAGPYRDRGARRYARAALIPGELLDRAHLDVARAAGGLGVPVGELLAARREHAIARRTGRSV